MADRGALLGAALAVRHDEVHAFNLRLAQADEMLAAKGAGLWSGMMRLEVRNTLAG
jgi:hypothetical protein